MRPFTMNTPADFLPDGPTSLGSKQWKRDFMPTRVLGGANSTLRSQQEGEIGLFWTEHTGQQYARAFGYLADSYELTVPDTAGRDSQTRSSDVSMQNTNMDSGGL